MTKTLWFELEDEIYRCTESDGFDMDNESEEDFLYYATVKDMFATKEEVILHVETLAKQYNIDVDIKFVEVQIIIS